MEKIVELNVMFLLMAMICISESYCEEGMGLCTRKSCGQTMECINSNGCDKHKCCLDKKGDPIIDDDRQGLCYRGKRPHGSACDLKEEHCKCSKNLVCTQILYPVVRNSGVCMTREEAKQYRECETQPGGCPRG